MQFCSADPFDVLLHQVVLLLHQVAIRDLAALHQQLARPVIHQPILPTLHQNTLLTRAPEHPSQQRQPHQLRNHYQPLCALNQPPAPLTSPFLSLRLFIIHT